MLKVYMDIFSSLRILQLELTIDDVKWAIVANKKLKIKQGVSRYRFCGDNIFIKIWVGNNRHPSETSIKNLCGW